MSKTDESRRPRCRTRVLGRRPPGAVLSQGQRRRVALARLPLAIKVPLWVLDEPSTALDAAAITHVQELFDRHVRDGGIVVLASHQDVVIRAGAIQTVELGG